MIRVPSERLPIRLTARVIAPSAPAITKVHEPKGETIRRGLRELGQPNASVMIGDRSHDIVGARENGIASIGVAWGVGDVGELESAGANLIIRDRAQLREAISSALTR